DLEGSRRDADGNENNWWTADDRSKFEALNEKLIQQINTFEMAPGMPTDGKRTITEDVADLGGMNIALDALVALLKEQGATADEIKAEQKTFFEYHAKRHRIIYSAEDLQGMLTDEHSVNKIRVNGIFQHMDTWYDLYNVVEGDSLYLPKEKRVIIW
ncbi:MAG: M13-type metalloendopeptidase, partial [Bacillota bacterium]|nr:M13-type metalloendopeptidase [Bacillota bacterium]